MGMRIALFSDVHGNLSALEAVLDSINRHQVDLTVFAGDLCLVGPRPAACVRLLRERRIPSVYGNTDEWVVLDRARSPDPLRELTRWTADQLSADDSRWLRSLPFSMTIGPTADPASALHIVHANPQDVKQIIYPPEAAQQTRYGEIRQPDSALAEMLAGLRAQTLAFGHLHIPSVRPWHNYLLLNISSVSMAGDDDSRAKYALATWDAWHWSAEHVFVEYDVQAEVDAYRSAQPPGWREAVVALEALGTIPQRI